MRQSEMREECVKVKGEKSSEEEVRDGVGEGKEGEKETAEDK